MSYSIASVDDRILVITESDDFDLSTEALPMAQEALHRLDAAPDRVVVIVDTRAHNMSSMSDVMAVSSVARSDIGKAVVKHPNLLKAMVVTNNAIARMTMKGISTATFGYIETVVYDTLEEALNDARSLLYGESRAN